jgi:hypothetical protein
MRGVILAEDKRTERFFRHLIGILGFDKRKFRFDTAPAGQGAAEAWVRARYPTEVNWLRSKAYQQQLCLIAIRDGDSVGVHQRKIQLNSALRQKGLQIRQNDERIATPVPTWCIETWLLALHENRHVDEDDSVKNEFNARHRMNEKSVLVLAAQKWRDDPFAGSSLPSLMDGRSEISRL